MLQRGLRCRRSAGVSRSEQNLAQGVVNQLSRSSSLKGIKVTNYSDAKKQRVQRKIVGGK